LVVHGAAVVVVDDVEVGFLSVVVVVVLDVAHGPLLEPSAWAPAPAPAVPDPATTPEPVTIGLCAADEMAESVSRLPQPAKSRATQATARRAPHWRCTRRRSRGTPLDEASAAIPPWCWIVLKCPPAKAHPG
jgi:hypothetical protein